MRNVSDSDTGVRRAEIVAALSRATDLVMGQPMEYALRSCVLAMRLGGAQGFATSVRVVTLAQDFIVLRETRGEDVALATIRSVAAKSTTRAGATYSLPVLRSF